MVGQLKKLICIDQSNFCLSSHPREFKLFNIPSKYFSFFNNKRPASWVAHKTRDFLTCYSCWYYSSTSISRKRKTLWREHMKSFVSCFVIKSINRSFIMLNTIMENENNIFSCFAIIFSIRTLWKRETHSHCFKKRRMSLQNLMFRNVISRHGKNH